MNAETQAKDNTAPVTPEDKVRFAEEKSDPLSDRDRDRFLDLLENPPEPPAALRRAVARHPNRRG